MARNNSTDARILRRTAAEIKKYRFLMRVLPALAGFLTVTVVVVYIITMLYNKYGSFTVTVSKFDSVKYALSLSETPDFNNMTTRLNSKASEEVTNISVADLPMDLDNVNGTHNGKNYVAYTFYLKNAGRETVTCEYQLYIANMTLDIERAVRIRLYRDGEYVDYARTRTDGLGAEPNTTEFYNETIITKERIHNFQTGDMTKFTVVIWLEGDDPDCVDSIIGGRFKVDMSINIISVESDETSLPEVAAV